MKGQKLLNTTLRINAAFSFLSGLDFILFDREIVGILTGAPNQSILPTGVMLIGFAVFVFVVSLMQKVNKYFVGAIIVMDGLWVVGSGILVAAAWDSLTSIGAILILAVAVVIAGFAVFQTKGLRNHFVEA